MKIVWGRSIGWNLDFKALKKEGMEYTIIEDGCDTYPWREVFAWRPVKTVSGKHIWWKKIFKRKVWVVWGTGFHMEPCVQYGTLFDILTYDNQYRYPE